MISKDILKEYLKYIPDTGMFIWIKRPSNRVNIGDIAGTVGPRGYRYISICRYRTFAHRLAWLYMVGEQPTTIDHIDGNKLNNSWKNLRELSQEYNTQNIKKARKHNSTGLLGATKDKKKFAACIFVKGKKIYLGSYNTPEEAHEVYMKKKKEVHPGYAQ